MPRKEKTTKTIFVEHLAQMTEREFGAVRSEMQAGFAKTHERIGHLEQTVEAGFESLSQTMKTMLTELRTVREDVVELHDLRSRIERLEKKAGLRA